MVLDNVIALAIKNTTIRKVNHVVVKTKKGYRWTMEKLWSGDCDYTVKYERDKVVVYDKDGKKHKTVSLQKAKSESKKEDKQDNKS